jgi:predicted HAD superfamily Cof-like phosphohydrolase
MNRTEQALEFRRSFRQPSMEPGKIKIPAELISSLELQLSLIEEEGNEFREALAAWQEASLREPSDALLEKLKLHVIKELSDLAFVCEQMAAFLGIDLETAMTRVFTSNMSKLGPDGQPVFREDGKVLKGANYIPPDLSDLA